MKEEDRSNLIQKLEQIFDEVNCALVTEDEEKKRFYIENSRKLIIQSIVEVRRM